MDIPKIFEQKNIEELEKMMLTYPFATLVNQGENGVRADHIPLYLQKFPNNKRILKESCTPNLGQVPKNYFHTLSGLF